MYENWKKEVEVSLFKDSMTAYVQSPNASMSISYPSEQMNELSQVTEHQVSITKCAQLHES